MAAVTDMVLSSHRSLLKRGAELLDPHDDHTEARVLFPEPVGPMMACTSPAFTSRAMPFNISFPATCARKFLTESISILLFLHS